MAGRVTPTPRVLAADDHPHVLSALKLLLRSEGFELETVTSPAMCSLFHSVSRVDTTSPSSAKP